MRIFFDTEFTGLHQTTTLISIGCIDENGRTFYAESTDFDRRQVDEWIQKNVINKLLFDNKQYLSIYKTSNYTTSTEFCGSFKDIAKELKDWLGIYENCEMWSDCLSYDWVLFNHLFGHAFNIPKNVYYIPFDICTMFKMKDIDPDISREEFAEIDVGEIKKHNALFDARIIRKCYNKLIRI